MREYRLLISHVGKDEEIALECVKAFEGRILNGDDDIKIVPVYMESKTDGCFGDFIKWSEEAVKTSDGVLAIVTGNTAETRVADDGTEANLKIVYNEVSLARNSLKDLLILRENGLKLETGYDILLQNIKCSYFEKDNLKEKIAEITNDIILHAKRRFGGNPLLEYAGKLGVNLIPSVVADTSEYLGRVAELDEIDNYFNSGKRIVCITGFGGIGKTTLAKMYAKAHSDEPVAIVYCPSEESSLRDAVINLCVEYDIPEFDKMTVDEKYAARIKQLKNLDRKTLIIIDNFNADFGLINNRTTIKDISEIEKCNFIISSRRTLKRNEVGVVEVGKLNDDELTELFYRDSHCERTEENDKLINDLIVRTNGHTMTVELAAKAVGIDENCVTLQEIVSGFLSVDAVTRLEDRDDGYDEYETIYSHLRKLFDLSRINETQKILLGALSFVPQYGLTVRELKDNIAYDGKDLLRLTGLGYIRKSEGTTANYSLHPLISELAFSDFVDNVAPFEKIIEFLIFDKANSTPDDTVADLELRFDFAEHIYGRLSKLVISTPSVKRNLSVSCNKLGNIARAKGDLISAELYYNQSYKLKKEIADETGTVEAQRDLSISCERLGDIAMTKGDLISAESYYKQSYELAKEIADESGTIQARRDLSISCERLGDIAGAKSDLNIAESFYKQSYKLRKEIADESGTIQARRDLSVSCNKFGNIARAKGDLISAELYYKQGYELAKEIADESGTIQARRGLAISCNNLGDIAKAKGDLISAESYYKQSYELAKEIADESGTIQARRGLSISCDRLGDIVRAKGDLITAVSYFNQGYELAKEIADESGTIQARCDLSVSCHKLGNIARAKGDLITAESYFNQGYELAKEIADESGTIQAQRDLSVSCNNLGDIAKAKGDLVTAVSHYNLCYKILKAIADETITVEARRDLSVSCDKLGNIAMVKGDLTTAVSYFNQVYELAKAIADETGTIEAQRDLSVSCNNLGDIAKAKGDLITAVSYFNQGNKLAKAIADQTNTPQSLDDLVISYFKLGTVSDFDKGLQYMLSALEIAEKLYNSHTDFNGRYKALLQILSKIYEEIGDTENYEKMQDILKKISKDD